MTTQFFLLRTAFCFVLLTVLDGIVAIPSPLWFLFLCITLGNVLAWRSHAHRETLLAGFLRFVALSLTGVTLCWIVGNLPTASGSFFFSNLSFHLTFGVILSSFALCSLWLVTYTRLYFYLELALLGISSVILFAGHRAFRFDRVELIGDLAWYLGIPPTGLTTLLGVISALMVLTYAVTTPSAKTTPPVKASNSRYSLRSLLSFSAFCFVLCAAAYLVNHYYQSTSRGLLTNGVRLTDSQEGISPLDFNSALGSTNTPAAVVRLEGDYQGNPYSPTMFFRESALSEFNGQTLVQASTEYDSDTPTTMENFTSNDRTGEEHRVSVTQSIFNLIEHKLFIGLDYPIEIRLLTNPNPARFKNAYRVYSMAAAHPKELLQNDGSVGEQDWTPQQWEHYTKTHPDERYAQLAKKIVQDETAPLRQAKMIQDYLIKNAIYTLTPGHTVTEEEDPVAPFLFGDMRGYCVHFSHAMVYLLRSLGIPARIGTGYLTDLGQSRDGHILLRLNDRHAWAEIYVRSIGWAILDVQPEQIESHAASEVDGKLLEELMGMLGTPSEFSDAATASQEPGLNDTPTKQIVTPKMLLQLLVLILLAGAMAKLYLRYGWLLPSSPPTKIKRYYRSVASWLVDLGLGRQFGETRSEYRERIMAALGEDALPIVDALLEVLYAETLTSTPSMSTKRMGKHLTFTTKCKAWCSTASLSRWIGGRSW